VKFSSAAENRHNQDAVLTLRIEEGRLSSSASSPVCEMPQFLLLLNVAALHSFANSSGKKKKLFEVV
jgi:hypothetical protein